MEVFVVLLILFLFSCIGLLFVWCLFFVEYSRSFLWILQVGSLTRESTSILMIRYENQANGSWQRKIALSPKLLDSAFSWPPGIPRFVNLFHHITVHKQDGICGIMCITTGNNLPDSWHIHPNRKILKIWKQKCEACTVYLYKQHQWIIH